VGLTHIFSTAVTFLVRGPYSLHRYAMWPSFEEAWIGVSLNADSADKPKVEEV
jgi:hypothetical protein